MGNTQTCPHCNHLLMPPIRGWYCYRCNQFVRPVFWTSFFVLVRDDGAYLKGDLNRAHDPEQWTEFCMEATQFYSLPRSGPVWFWREIKPGHEDRLVIFDGPPAEFIERRANFIPMREHE